MAYPRKQRAENPNAESSITSVTPPVVDKVTVPRASAVGGAPKLPETQRRRWWNEQETELAKTGGNRIVNATPGPWSLQEIMEQRQPMVDFLKERLQERNQQRGSQRTPDAEFWERVELAPDAVAASLLRRLFVLMTQRQDNQPEWAQVQFMNREDYETLKNQEIFRWLQSIRSLNGRP